MQTLYEVLKVQEDAPIEVIRAAYKVLSSKYHPDKNPGDSEASEMMQKINRAYNILRDPEARARYDAALKRTRDQQQAKTATPQFDEMEAQPSSSETSRSSSTDTSTAQSFGETVGRIWSGRMGLCKTYWVYGVLASFIWGIAIRFVTPGSALAITLVLAFVIYLVVINTGIWRAADRYTGYAIWAILAKVAVAGPIAALVVGTAAAIFLPAYQDYKTNEASAIRPAPATAEAFDPTTARPIDPQPAIALEPQPTPEQIHDQSILSAHPDAFQIARTQPFQTWLKANPAFQRVANGGTADEVIRMLTIYKSTPTPPPSRPVKIQEIAAPSKDTEKAMQNLNDWSNRHWNGRIQT